MSKKREHRGKGRIDLIGKRFGRLVVLKFDGLKNGCRSMWKCICDCGDISIIDANSLKEGSSKSCGCLQKELVVKLMTTHGFGSSKNRVPEYTLWINIKARCYNKNNPDYKKWGAKGVSMCDRWLNSFEDFFEDVGRRPSDIHSLDRYPNKSGNYEPGNVRWATSKEQARNTIRNRIIKYDNKEMIVSDWLKVLKVPQTSFYRQLRLGLDAVAIFNMYKQS
jgi:hypothetical protein